MSGSAAGRWASPAFRGMIGIETAVITPPSDIHLRNWGASPHRQATGIHQDLLAVVLTIRDTVDHPPLVMASLDLGWWMDPEDEATLRESVAATLGLTDSQLVLALTHTHAGPSLRRADRDQPGGAALPDYLDEMAYRIGASARTALAAEGPATLDWEYGRCTLATHRDLPLGNRVVSGFNPDGRADDTLLVGRVCAPDGRIQAVVVNYACHPTTLAWQNSLLSPDFVGPMRDLIHDEVGVPCVFLQGASGELAPRLQYTDDLDVVRHNGRQLGFAILSTLEGMQAPGTELALAAVVESGAPLAVWRSQPTELDSTVARCRRILQLPRRTEDPPGGAGDTDDARAAAMRAERAARIARAAGTGPTVAFPVTAWRIGGALLIAHPGEAYSMLQTVLRGAFPGHAVVVVNLAGGVHLGYLPPSAVYDTDTYQVWQTPLGRGSLEQLAEISLDVLRELAQLHDTDLTAAQQ